MINKEKEKTRVNNIAPLLAQPKERKTFDFSLSAIEPSDRELLQEAVKHFRPQSINYEDSWGYVIQATRYSGFKWYDPRTGSIIFFGRKSNTDNTLVVPVFFAEIETLTKVITFVQKKLNTPKTILKNVNREDIDKFLRYGFRTYKEEEYWDPEARFDDQTYPQRIIDLEQLHNARGRKYRNIRIALNKNTEFQLKKYEKEDLENVLNLFAEKDGNLHDYNERVNGMYYVSHAMYPNSDMDKYVVKDPTGRIVGFTAISDISTMYTALVAAIFDSHTKHASAWGFYQTLMTKYNKGFKLANLGGCETKDSYDFIELTFRPIKELAKTHLVYENNMLQ